MTNIEFGRGERDVDEVPVGRAMSKVIRFSTACANDGKPIKTPKSEETGDRRCFYHMLFVEWMVLADSAHVPYLPTHMYGALGVN